MIVTEPAAQRLAGLLARSREGSRGFRLEGVVGTCRGSAPVLEPAAGPEPGECEVQAGGLAFFALPALAGLLEDATLDYDGRLFGRGLNMTWPHRQGGCPACR